MMQTINRELRERFAVKYRRLHNEVTALLGQDDRMGIVFERNLDEYSIESHRIVDNLFRCCAEEDVAQLVYEEYDRQFGLGGRGSSKDYAQLGRDIWSLWQKCLQDDAPAWNLLAAEGKETGKSHCFTTTASCPKCQAETDIFNWDCVNGTDDPSLRDDLLEGRLNVLRCGACGEELLVGKQSIIGNDLLYVDTRRGYCVQYCSLWMERMDDRRWRDAFFKGDFTKDGKPAKSGDPTEADPPCMADPHVVLDMEELRRYVRFRDRLFDLYEELGDELFPVPAAKGARGAPQEG